MSSARFIKARVSPDLKKRVRALAEHQLITESVLLKRLVVAAFREPMSDLVTPTRAARNVDPRKQNGVLDHDGEPSMRVYIRLRPDDRLLLRERASARGMPSATYVSVLVRSHLRNLAPLPKAELVALKQSVAELGAIGRNLNQLARAANNGDPVVGPSREDLRAMLKVCEALRDHVKGLVRANVNAWDIGHVEPES